MAATALILVPFAPQHFSTLAAWFSDEREVVQWGGPAVRFPLDADQMQVMLDESRSRPPTRLCWMAQSADSDLVGHAQVAVNWRHGNVTIGRVTIAPAHRGQGLAASLMSLILTEAFSIQEVERVELNVYAWNAPAIRTYEGAGFRREGVRRSSTRVGADRWDTMMMSQLRGEYVQPS